MSELPASSPPLSRRLCGVEKGMRGFHGVGVGIPGESWSKLLSLPGLGADAGEVGQIANLKSEMITPGSEAAKTTPGTNEEDRTARVNLDQYGSTH